MRHTALTSLVLPAVLGLAMVVAGCKGEEKAKPAPPPPPPRPVEKPQAVAPEPPPPPPRKERPAGKVVKSVSTAQGKLKIVRHGTGPLAEYSVVLGDRTLVDPAERPIEVAGSQSSKGKARLVLLRFRHRDKACPALFRVADLTRGKDPKVSDEFGNCSARPKASATKAGWKLAFPRAGSAKAATWTYANGALREPGGKPVRPDSPTYTGTQ